MLQRWARKGKMEGEREKKHIFFCFKATNQSNQSFDFKLKQFF
jgi:hypothetical protein